MDSAAQPSCSYTALRPRLTAPPARRAQTRRPTSTIAATVPTSADPASAATPPDAPPQRLHSLARAARHDILRRLAPPLRHDMVVHLQSLGMLAEALNARLDRAAATNEEVHEAVSRLHRLARQAVATCVEVSTWMQPAENDTIPLREGIDECVRLLATSLDFHGFTLRAEAGDADLDVSRSALRFLLPAAIFTLTDAAPAPGQVTLRTPAASRHGVVVVRYAPQPEGSFTRLHDPGEHPLAWAEVEALAAEAAVELERGADCIVLRLPRVTVTTPLAMAPV